WKIVFSLDLRFPPLGVSGARRDERQSKGDESVCGSAGRPQEQRGGFSAEAVRCIMIATLENRTGTPEFSQQTRNLGDGGPKREERAWVSWNFLPVGLNVKA